MDNALIPTALRQAQDEEPIELNLDNLNFDLPDELRNLHTLEVFEEQAIIAFGDLEEAYQAVNDSYTRAAYHIHMILEHDLWQFRRTPDGELMFQTQEDYLESLAGRTIRGFAVSTVKGYHTALRIAHKWLGYSREEIEQRGIYIFNAIQQAAIKDYKTAEPKGLKRGLVPTGQTTAEYLREVVEETYTNNGGQSDVVMRPKDFKLELERKLAPRKPRIEFTRIQGSDTNKLHWTYERYDDAGQLIFLDGYLFTTWNGNPPASVLTEFLHMLKVDLED